MSSHRGGGLEEAEGETAEEVWRELGGGAHSRNAGKGRKSRERSQVSGPAGLWLNETNPGPLFGAGPGLAPELCRLMCT